MAVLKYKFGIWNQTNANFSADDSNEQLIAEVLAYALQAGQNVMIVGVSNNWYAGKDYTCNTPTGDFVRMLFNDTSGIYTSFLSKQKIFLFTMRWSIIPITKMSKLLKNACEQTGIAVSAGVIKKNTGSTNDSPKCCIYFINGVTKTKNIHKYCSFSKDDVITYFGDNPIGVQHKVVFVDYNNSILLDVQSVLDGYDAVQPAQPYRSGYAFSEFKPSPCNVKSDLTCVAQYVKISEDYSVTFADYDGKTLKDVQTVHEGDDATPPETPSRDGYVFTGWAPSYLNVQSDLTCVAQYQSDDFIQQNAITDKMFRGNTSLQHVELPGAITSIGNESFAHCMSLSSISMDGVKKIGESAFYGTQIDELKLNSGLTSLAQCSLSGTSKLLYVTMNQSELDGFNDNALRGASLTSIRFTQIDSTEVLQ